AYSSSALKRCVSSFWKRSAHAFLPVRCSSKPGASMMPSSVMNSETINRLTDPGPRAPLARSRSSSRLKANVRHDLIDEPIQRAFVRGCHLEVLDVVVDQQLDFADDVVGAWAEYREDLAWVEAVLVGWLEVGHVLRR